MQMSQSNVPLYPSAGFMDTRYNLLHGFYPGSHPATLGTTGFKGMLLYQLGLVLQQLRPRLDDDFSDKLNYFYTVIIITCFALLVGAKQYVGSPIQCWVPATFTPSMEQYTESYCWAQNTYFVPYFEDVPEVVSDRRDRQIGYYQWTPFTLALQALMMLIPCFVWRGLLYWHSGRTLQGLVQLASEARLVDPLVQHKTIQRIARHIQDGFEFTIPAYGRTNMGGTMLDRHRQGAQGCSSLRLKLKGGPDRNSSSRNGFYGGCCSGGGSCCGGKRFCGFYVCSVYLFVKLLYVANIVFQFWLLNTLLGTQDLFFGYRVLMDLVHNEQWEETGVFPRVTLCDFEVRVLGNVHRHTVQCVLILNMFNEKIFIFLWFWFLAIGIVNLCNIFYWTVVITLPNQMLDFVRSYLRASADPEVRRLAKGEGLRRFVFCFLRSDGVLMLRMMAAHAGEMVTSEVILTLWGEFSGGGGGGLMEKMAMINIPESPSGTPRGTLDS